MRIYLSKQDVEKAHEVARTREETKRLWNISNQKVVRDRSDLLVDVRGALAEIAIGKLLAINIDPGCHLNGDRGYDLMIDGQTIDVKYTFYPSGHLLIKSKASISANLYFLVTGDESSMNWLAWIDGESFQRNGFETDFGYGTVFAIAQRSMNKPESFMPFIDSIPTNNLYNGKAVSS